MTSLRLFLDLFPEEVFIIDDDHVGFVNNYNTNSLKYIQVREEMMGCHGWFFYNTLHIIIADDVDQ